MRVAIYCRVSTHDQNCERQERDLVEYAQRLGYEVIGIWSEFGSGVKLDRVKRKEVMSIARKGKIDAVLVTELTRWGRSTIDLINTLNDLHRACKEITSCILKRWLTRMKEIIPLWTNPAMGQIHSCHFSI
jgi:DNA invertase Pin-like site-specific DNA recombinase